MKWRSPTTVKQPVQQDTLRVLPPLFVREHSSFPSNLLASMYLFAWMSVVEHLALTNPANSSPKFKATVPNGIENQRIYNMFLICQGKLLAIRFFHSSLLPILLLPSPSRFHTCGKEITKRKGGKESLDLGPQQVLVNSDHK